MKNLNRRNFLKATAVGVSVVAASNSTSAKELIALPNNSGRQIIRNGSIKS
jgi:hypothetical protein